MVRINQSHAQKANGVNTRVDCNFAASCQLIRGQVPVRGPEVGSTGLQHRHSNMIQTAVSSAWFDLHLSNLHPVADGRGTPKFTEHPSAPTISNSNPFNCGPAILESQCTYHPWNQVNFNVVVQFGEALLSAFLKLLFLCCIKILAYCAAFANFIKLQKT